MVLRTRASEMPGTRLFASAIECCWPVMPYRIPATCPTSWAEADGGSGVGQSATTKVHIEQQPDTSPVELIRLLPTDPDYGPLVALIPLAVPFGVDMPLEHAAGLWVTSGVLIVGGLGTSLGIAHRRTKVWLRARR